MALALNCQCCNKGRSTVNYRRSLALDRHIFHVMIIVTDGFSKKSFFIFRNNCTQMFFKRGVIRNIVIFTRKHLCWSLFLLKLEPLSFYFISTTSQETSTQMFSCENCKILRIVFVEHIRRVLLSV